ncbi:hypothetical protein DWX08_10375 [Ruminococcus sp. AF18-22]|jgi:hypothetical protein|nr:hypothetical protein DWX08_10375 [Ruminococcus sp. AF18-22]DAS83860.1 MAG TPA: hypothetical protein [Caudoviricetes sp.]
MREEIIQKMYEHHVNEYGLSEEISGIFDSITEKVEELSNVDEAELIGNKLVFLEHAVFVLAVNTVLDFISGREVA